MSQEAFVPTISNERGLLSVVSKPSVFSFAKQSAQINTLCLVSAATTHVDLKLTAGEVWVFGDLAGGAVPLEVCSAHVRAGDVTVVNVPAASISLKQTGRRELDLGPPRRRQQRRQQQCQQRERQRWQQHRQQRWRQRRCWQQRRGRSGPPSLPHKVNCADVTVVNLLPHKVNSSALQRSTKCARSGCR
jgi:hypothetical protein